MLFYNDYNIYTNRQLILHSEKMELKTYLYAGFRTRNVGGGRSPKNGPTCFMILSANEIVEFITKVIVYA